MQGEDNNSLRHSSTALLNSTIFRTDNKLTIFIEDTDKEYRYEFLFDRLFKNTSLEENYVIKSSGCKNKSYGLIDEYKKQVANGIPCGLTFFIVDGDFDVLFGNVREEDNLLYLRKYDIEASVFSEEVVRLLNRKYLQMTKATERAFFDFEKWRSICVAGLVDLFLFFALCCKFEDDYDRSSVGKYININNGHLRDEAFNSLSEHLKEICCNNDSCLDVELNNIKSNCNCNMESDLSIVSGKFLIFSLFGFLQSLCKHSNIKVKGFIIERFIDDLFKECNLDEFLYLKETIITYYENKIAF